MPRCLLLSAFLVLFGAVQSTPISFRVNMAYQIDLGRFDPATDFVDVAGTFNNWGASLMKLTDPDGDRVYEVTVDSFAPGQAIEYKFRLNGQWGGREEFPGAGNNRRYTVQAGTNVIEVWYNDETAPTGPPEAAFAAAPQVVSEGGIVYFTDRSSGLVSDWAWTFKGGFPGTSTEQHPVVRYPQQGTFDVALVVSSDAGRDTLLLSDFVEVRPRASSMTAWWNDAVFYEVFVRSFYDSDGDGIGDFNGLTAKLDYLNDGDPETTDDLGVTTLWLMPIHDSPSYHGYDVTDYRSVHPDYGSMEDFQRFLDEAHARGIRVIIDFVVNHSSSRHPWFQASARGEAPYRDFYRWSATRPGYAGPWGQQVWHGGARGFYYGVFWGGMPDLNFAVPAVQDSIFAAADFWIRDVGVDGFRLDAVKYIFEDGSALEDLPATHQFWNSFTEHIRQTDEEAYTVCEAWTSTQAVLPYQREGGLSSCFEFDLSSQMLGAVSGGDTRALAAKMQEVYDSYPYLQFATFLTNHDQDRAMSVLGQDEGKAKAAAGLLLTLPGIPYLYYGEEVGMVGTKPDEHIRRPMQWTGAPGAGFTTGSPWIAPGANAATHHVAAQQADPASLLSWYRRLISVRTEHAAIRKGSYHAVPTSHPSVYTFLRTHESDVVLVLTNLSALPAGAVRLSLPPGLLAPGDYEVQNLLDPGHPLTVVVDDGYEISNVGAGSYETQIYLLSSATLSSNETDVHPEGLHVRQNRPNPARGSTVIPFSVSASGFVTLEVFNALGQRVRTPLEGIFSPGTHVVEVDTRGLAAGFYYYRLRQGGQQVTGSMTVVQ